MAALISHITIDSQDPYQQSLWWSEVLGFAEDPEDPNLLEHEECMIFAPDEGTRMLFTRVPEQKTIKNRFHLDLKPARGTRDDELERLTALGAGMLQDRRRLDGSGWVVLTDPEGNEFCILRSDAERADAT